MNRSSRGRASSSRTDGASAWARAFPAPILTGTRTPRAGSAGGSGAPDQGMTCSGCGGESRLPRAGARGSARWEGFPAPQHPVDREIRPDPATAARSWDPAGIGALRPARG
jgi:hypothetical protein